VLLLRLLFVLNALFLVEPSRGSRALQLCEWLAVQYRNATYKSDPNLPQHLLALLDGRRLLFKDHVGQGKNALVKSIAAITDEKHVVKFGRNTEGVVAIEEEWQLYQELSPRERRFVLPILEAPHSQSRGRVLIRPLLERSPSLATLILNNVTLTGAEAVSLCQILRWRTEFQLKFGAPLDANPTNLVLVNDPEDLARLKAPKPRFFLYEATKTTSLDAAIINFLFMNALLKELDFCQNESGIGALDSDTP